MVLVQLHQSSQNTNDYAVDFIEIMHEHGAWLLTQPAKLGEHGHGKPLISKPDKPTLKRSRENKLHFRCKGHAHQLLKHLSESDSDIDAQGPWHNRWFDRLVQLLWSVNVHVHEWTGMQAICADNHPSCWCLFLNMTTYFFAVCVLHTLPAP